MNRKKTLVSATVLVPALALTACSGGFDADKGGSDNAANGTAQSSTKADKVYRVSFNQTETHPEYVALTNLGERMAKATGGKCNLQIFANETLGNQKDSIELVQAGTLDFAVVVGPLMENFNPDFVVLDLPYTFDSKEHHLKVLNDPEITGDLFDSVKAQDIEILTGFHAGVRNVYNSKKPIEKPEDLNGMKIRVIESDNNIDMMKLMGGSGAPMGQGEVYTAIQSGVIDGGENNESTYANLKHDEIAPYYSYTRHLMFPDYLITNPKVMEDMDPECAEFLRKDLPNAQKEQSELWDEEVERSIEMSKKAGAQFNEVDIEAFRTALAPMVDQKLTNDNTREIYKKIRAAAN